MDRSLPYILLVALAVVGVLCLLAMISDLRTGSNRFAHESNDVSRDRLPLNYWLGVANKGMGVVAAVALSVGVVHWML